MANTKTAAAAAAAAAATTATATNAIAATATTTSTNAAAAAVTVEEETKFSMQLNASELTAIIMKGSPNSNDRDAGFCSGSSEGGDDLCLDHARLEPSSPESPDASENSVEVKVTPIALIRNKRKSSEPAKLVCERDTEMVNCTVAAAATTLSSAPLKKRIRYTSTTDSAVVLTPPAAATPPSQLWDPSQVLPHELMPNPAQVFVRHPGVTTLHRMPAAAVQEQLEPLALVSKKSTSVATPMQAMSAEEMTAATAATQFYIPKKLQQRNEPQASGSSSSCSKSSSSAGTSVAADLLPLALTTSSKASTSAAAARTAKTATQTSAATLESTALTPPAPTCASVSVSVSASASIDGDSKQSGSGSIHGGASSSTRPQQRNYKNMTRERRIEANARERTRVHTISAAYETLRRAVPSYSNAQKLSKLSVLRIACSYILTLSRMAGYDYSIDQSEPSIAECFEAVTETIQTEGKIRKKKDE